MGDEYKLCCCCHELLCIKSLWTGYEWMGKTEVYGNMIKDCFNLSWPQPTKDRICEVCITQLRNAVNFREKLAQSVLGPQELIPLVKVERLETESGDIPDIEIVAKIESIDECDEKADDALNRADKDDELDSDDLLNDEDLLNDDFVLDDDDEKNNAGTSSKPVEAIKTYDNNNGKEDGAVKDYEGKKTLKRKTRKTTESKTTSTTSTPKKTIKKSREDIDKKTTNYVNPRQNAGLILEHSTIIPFRSNKGYFNCFYCNKQYAVFDQLRTHDGESHKNLSLKTILKSIRRPRDPIRADVSDITCKICKKKKDNLEILIQHLTNDHDVEFNSDNDALKPTECIVPYDLSDGKYKCYQCKAEFHFFKTLSNHMNEHSTAYVCDICGRCFLLADRLRAHTLSHKEKKAVECDLCGKICGSDLLLKSHKRYKHKSLPFICSICDEAFPNSLKRVQHLEEVHNRAPLDLNCKICSKKFGKLKSLHAHMRIDHKNMKNDPKNACKVCGMKFKCRNVLSHHMVVHTGEKNFECDFCHKKYSRRKTLTQHLQIHSSDRRFACRACSQAFVQKCSLKNHIRVHHGDKDYERLIIDKKLNVE